MKIAMIVGGVLLVLWGLVWVLQGVNVLPGSFMSGQMQWAVFGVILILVGGWLGYSGLRRKPPTTQA
jgi:hypothetical protein